MNGRVWVWKHQKETPKVRDIKPQIKTKGRSESLWDPKLYKKPHPKTRHSYQFKKNVRDGMIQHHLFSVHLQLTLAKSLSSTLLWACGYCSMRLFWWVCEISSVLKWKCLFLLDLPWSIVTWLLQCWDINSCKT